MSPDATLFSGAVLDRRAELRDDPEWLAAARADPGTRFVVTDGARQLVCLGESLDVALLNREEPLVALASRDASLTLLGWFRGERTVLIALSVSEPDVRLVTSSITISDDPKGGSMDGSPRREKLRLLTPLMLPFLV